MNRTEKADPSGGTLTTADLAAAGRQAPDPAEDAERRDRQINRPQERITRDPEFRAAAEGS